MCSPPPSLFSPTPKPLLVSAALAVAGMDLAHRSLLLFLLLVLSPALDLAAATDAGDLAAMQALSKTLGGSAALGWTDSTDPCSSWPGVGCDGSGRVVRIQAGSKSLSGTIAPEIASLTSLTRLELQSNSLSGALPSLAGLSSLQVLLLQSNQFTSIPPDFFSGLSSLTVVDIDSNPFAAWQLPASLADATALVNFSANSANVTGGIPSFFNGSVFPSLSHVALASNFMSGPVPSSLAGLQLQSLWLNNQKDGWAFSGGIAFITNMSSVQQLWLQSNHFTGPLPDFSALTALWDLDLRDNKLTGPVPASLVQLKSLKNLTLTNNLLQGPAPAFPSQVYLDLDPSTERFCTNDTTQGSCDPRVDVLLVVASGFGYPELFADGWQGNNPCSVSWLGIRCDASGNIIIVNFANMGLNGTISPAFANLTSLQRLLLHGNNLSGTIPASLASLSTLKELDVSNNNLYGLLPAFASNVIVNTDGNPNIGKEPPPTGSGSSSDGGGTPPGPTSGSSASQQPVGIIIGSVAAGFVAIVIVGASVLFYYKRKQRLFNRAQGPNGTVVVHPHHLESDSERMKHAVVDGSHVNGSMASNTLSRTSSSPSELHLVEAGNMFISIQVLRNVTNNFSNENVLGRGGFGTVYRGELHDGTKIAVKRMEAGVMGNKGLIEFQSEISVLTNVRHRNLVSLLGYCLDGNERILVYEFMPQGTLSEHLFDWKKNGQQPLGWKKRLSIALDVARAVEYLHSLANHSFIHRDLKPSNILLGDDMKAKVADFGLVRLAPSDGKYASVETRLAGTFGYLAPEYAATGRVTTKADVYSFGVILMELITGRRALDESQPEESMHLVTWFRRMQLNKGGFHKAVDPTIDLDEETLVSINTVAELAGHCTSREPQTRPDMGHAVNVLSNLIDVWKPSEMCCSNESDGIDLDMTLPQALRRWQASDNSYSHYDGATSSFLASLDNSRSSIPTRPDGFADTFTSADGR